ncbi:MAG: hypothetical protein PHI11_09400 [Gallionella sp.]|nr:hypothetical protein [Gallionella sp.]
MLKTLGNVIKWIVATLVLLTILFFILNHIDESLQPDAEKLLHPSLLEVPPEKNAYFTLIGLTAPSGVNAAEWGLKTSQAHRLYTPPILSNDPVCDLEAQHCLRLANQHPEQLQQALAAQPELVARYIAARQFPQFSESTGKQSIDPYPNFSAAFRAQTLRHAQIALWVEAGKMDAVLAELTEDMAFQRRCLTGAQTLIGKMVTLAALQRDYVLLADLMRAKPSEMAAQQAKVHALLIPLTATERDMLPAIRHEFRMLSAALRSFKYESLREEWAQAAVWIDTIRAPLMENLLLRNASINRLYQLEQADEALARALPQHFAQKQAEARALSIQLSDVDWRYIYNPVGKWLVELSRVDYHRYIRRPHELDAFIRLMILQQQITDMNITEANLPAFLNNSAPELHNPFNGQPVSWDADRHELFIELAGGALQYKRYGKNRQRIALPLAIK